MEESRNQHQIIRKDNKNCFVESLSDAFEIGKAHLAFATYDLNKPAGNRQTNCVHIYISIPEWLELCRKLACGELRYLWQERKKAGDNRPVQEWLGGTSAEKLLQYGKARPDGKSLSRVARLCTAQKFDFLFTASSGPGDKDSKGPIVPRFGKKPENHVAVLAGSLVSVPDSNGKSATASQDTQSAGDPNAATGTRISAEIGYAGAFRYIAVLR